MTKNEERRILTQIENLINATGKDSYINMAFAGCVDMARSNIDNDFANNPQESIQNLRTNLENTQKHLDNANEEIRKLKTELKERKPLPANLYRQLWFMLDGQKEEAQTENAKIAEVLSYCESPTETGVQSYMNALKQNRIKRENATALMAELEKYEPKNI